MEPAGPSIIDGFSTPIDRGEVVRLLGSGKRDGMWGDARVDETLDEALSLAGELVHQRGIYSIARGGGLPGSTMFADLGIMAFCICTIGPDLEERVTELNNRGRLLRGVVLDAAGSVAAEATAQYMDERIQELAAAKGLRTSCRASPGYGDWDIREQRCIFELLPAGKIGVELSETCMMSPRKSVSFAIHIDENPVRLRSENSCRNCDRANCPYRLLD